MSQLTALQTRTWEAKGEIIAEGVRHDGPDFVSLQRSFNRVSGAPLSPPSTSKLGGWPKIMAAMAT
jgi:hypothetical protein